MKIFWPIYVSSLIVGTVGVYVASPLARPLMAGLLGKRDVTAQSASHEAAREFSGPRPPQTPLPAAAPTEHPQPPSNASAATDGDELPPAVQGISLATSSDKPEWGVTQQRATYYKSDGSRLGHVPGGTLIAFKEKRPSSKGLMIACKILAGGSSNDVYLVSTKDVYLFTGSYSLLSPRQLTALKDYYALNGNINQRKNELLQISASKNPFFTAYNAAYTVYMAHIEKAKALTAQRDHATEGDKSRFEDQLREMKIAETRLRAEYDDAHLKFRSWKDQHANEIVKPENDPEVKKWTLEMSALRSVVPGLAL